MPSVYIMLTRTNTLFSRAIGRLTGDSYTHASLSLDRSLERMYSIARLRNRMLLPAGLLQEDLRRGVYARNAHAPCAIYELPVRPEVYRAVESRLNDMMREQSRYRYNLLGIARYLPGGARPRPDRYFCSEFVADTLARAGALDLCEAPSLIRPSDFTRMDLRLVYEGPLYSASGFRTLSKRSAHASMADALPAVARYPFSESLR